MEKEKQRKERRQEDHYKLPGGEVVPVSDEALGEEEEVVEKVLKYGGVELDADEEAVLRMPAKFKVPPKLKIEEIITELHTGAVKARLEKEN
jgi:hypothetical protein